LRAYSWPDNFASLRLAADRLAAISRLGATHKAAQELDVAPATLYHWYAKTMGLSRPLVPSAAVS
jgi:DNA-binding NtrC family response regulator